MKHLFVVCVGGMVEGCQVEMHDVRFVVGASIEECYEDLRSEWVGVPESLHLDAWLKLQYVDGYEVSFSDVPQEREEKLFFVNVGAYDANYFGELHEIGFFVCKSESEAKEKALANLCQGKFQVHRDDLRDVDDCLEVSRIGEQYVHLLPTKKTQKFMPDWFGCDTDVRKI